MYGFKSVGVGVDLDMNISYKDGGFGEAIGRNAWLLWGPIIHPPRLNHLANITMSE
jgi:hypothetical protein